MQHEDAKSDRLKTRLLAVTTRSQAKEAHRECIPKEKRSELITDTPIFMSCRSGKSLPLFKG
jgi:hypothetical protein